MKEITKDVLFEIFYSRSKSNCFDQYNIYTKFRNIVNSIFNFSKRFSTWRCDIERSLHKFFWHSMRIFYKRQVLNIDEVFLKLCIGEFH